MRMSLSSIVKAVEHFGHRTIVSRDQAHVQPEERTPQIPMMIIKVAILLKMKLLSGHPW